MKGFGRVKRHRVPFVKDVYPMERGNKSFVFASIDATDTVASPFLEIHRRMKNPMCRAMRCSALAFLFFNEFVLDMPRMSSPSM